MCEYKKLFFGLEIVTSVFIFRESVFELNQTNLFKNMADENLHIPLKKNMDYHINTLLDHLQAVRNDSHKNTSNRMSNTFQPMRNMQTEIRTLEFWRSVVSECLASFLYVFIVCGAGAGAGVGASVSSVLLATALASGLAMTALTQCFIHISGAHINPAVTLASAVLRIISPLRAAMYITAQCGGSIGGAALLYGVTVPGYQGNLQAAISQSVSLGAWERFGVEFILTFVVVLSYFISTNSLDKSTGNSAHTIGVAYSACSFVSMPYLNPARSLGPSFVLSRWDNHWVYWFGPMVGGIASGVLYEYIFSSRLQSKLFKSSANNDTSLQSEDGIQCDIDLRKSDVQATYSETIHRSQSGVYNRRIDSGNSFCQNLYTDLPPTKPQQLEPLYGGTRSLYCRSPTLDRNNLNRSQSLYTKNNIAIAREVGPQAGPLVPAQSLYPINFTNQQSQSSHLQNQNVQNQLQQRSESIYGIRAPTRPTQQPHEQLKQLDSQQRCQTISDNRGKMASTDGNVKIDYRPESFYSVAMHRNLGQSIQSDDSSYGSYHGPAVRHNAESLTPYTSSSHPNNVQDTPYKSTQSERKILPSVITLNQQVSSGSMSPIYVKSHESKILHQLPQELPQQEAQQRYILQHQHSGIKAIRRHEI